MIRKRVMLALVVASTSLGLMGTNLVLPAIPSLPKRLGGDAPGAQLVLASYAAGTCLGLLLFGALRHRRPIPRSRPSWRKLPTLGRRFSQLPSLH